MPLSKFSPGRSIDRPGRLATNDMGAQSQLEKVERLKEILVQYATGQPSDGDEYRTLRKACLTDPLLKSRIPSWVGDCADLGEFWSFIQPMFARYHERREFLKSEFLPIIRELEFRETSAGTATVAESLAKVDWEHVQDAVRKAHDRIVDDPEGAVTSARTLLETVYKHILDAKGIAYAAKDDLQKLHNTTAKSLKLAPDSSTEPAFREMLTGCYTIVNGVSALRNAASDAHGKGLRSVSTERRHAELAVNLAGALASFLISTFDNNPS
jgi:hypothetical protein